MQVFVMIEGQEGVTWHDWLALATAVEDAGLPGLFCGDHYSAVVRPAAASLDAWAMLSALAASTTRIRLGTLVSPATFRHPSVLARMVVTVDHVSGGRVELGMGAGWHERDHVESGFPFLDTRSRFDLLAEQVEVIVRSWTEEGFDHQGDHYVLHGQRALPRPVQSPHPPLIIGGSARPRSAALAARFAQEYNGPYVTVAEFGTRRMRLDRACVEAGRDPSTLRHSVLTSVVLGENRAEVRERLPHVLELHGETLDPGAALADPPKAWLVGTIEEVAEQIAEYEQAGVSRMYLKHIDHTEVSSIASLAALARAVA